MTALRYESLADKVVLVTGASRGIGRGIALAFGEQGALVLVNSRAEERVTETVEAIVAAGGSAETAVAADGAPGGQAILEMLQNELARDMPMSGKPNLKALDPSLVRIHAR